ncbi:dihydrolipoamide acetyltransferase family protein [Streptomyces sp. NPDC059788]|uniref:dihydrolipoamide acetyltransferase family protein n=1 Tax=Streptomyces sp. NPDC059788 TaxID=3346948 RepID=UPI0036577BD3
MAQVLEFRLPDLGQGLTEAEIVSWLVGVGDVVVVDQPVVEVETSKARVEVPCPYDGVVTARFGEEGSELPVGARLMTVAVGGGTEPVPGAVPRAKTSSGPADGGPGEGDTSGNVLVGYGTAAPSARRRRVAPDGLRAHGSPLEGAPVDSGPVASTGARSAAVAAGPVPVVSPLVRRLARQHGLDLRQLAGSGRQGLILRADVEWAIGQGRAEARSPQSASRGPASPAAAAAVGARVPLKGVRGAVAEKMTRSRREIPEATCWVDADATELMAARAVRNAAGGSKISLLALLARLCTAALGRFPELNATVDSAAREVVRLPAVHLGFAAQTDRGLVVPVVRDAHTRSAASLAQELARLTDRAVQGALAPAEMAGGTFTLNNYGVFGVDGATPIINHPEAAMLGVGRIMPRPWVHHGELAVRQVVQLSLTFDHRVCDGGVAGGFLRHVADCVEQPATLM